MPKINQISPDTMLKYFNDSVRIALPSMPAELTARDFGLFLIAIAAGVATNLGATKEELEVHWTAVMKDLTESVTEDAKAAEAREKFRIVPG